MLADWPSHLFSLDLFDMVRGKQVEAHREDEEVEHDEDEVQGSPHDGAQLANDGLGVLQRERQVLALLQMTKSIGACTIPLCPVHSTEDLSLGMYQSSYEPTHLGRIAHPTQ